jgi:hypothetical protein
VFPECKSIPAYSSLMTHLLLSYSLYYIRAILAEAPFR